MLIFVTGGVRSGKSTFAEQLAIKLFHNSHHNSIHNGHHNRLYYLATSKNYDVEMEERIHRHQTLRAESRAPWHTWEKSENISILAPIVKAGDIVLLDCLTTLFSNELFKDWRQTTARIEDFNFREYMLEGLLDDILQFHYRGTVIVVSNELSFQPIPDDLGTFYYAKMLGLMHQRLVYLADEAYLVEHGVSRPMKGGR